MVWFGWVWFDFMANRPLKVIQCQILSYIDKQFYSKQLSLALVRSLNVKTVLFQILQFNKFLFTHG